MVDAHVYRSSHVAFHTIRADRIYRAQHSIKLRSSAAAVEYKCGGTRFRGRVAYIHINIYLKQILQKILLPMKSHSLGELCTFKIHQLRQVKRCHKENVLLLSRNNINGQKNGIPARRFSSESIQDSRYFFCVLISFDRPLKHYK